MGCGCGAKGVKNIAKKGYKPVIVPSGIMGTTPTSKPKTISAQSQSTTQSNNSGLTSERREQERKRRETLLKKLGRL